MQRTAQCLCGSLRAIASGEPRFNNICSCQACQRRTGSVIHAGAFFLKEDVRCEGAPRYTSAALIADAKSIITFALSAARLCILSLKEHLAFVPFP